MKKILMTVFFLTVISFGINGQTNVSGGIYSNTVWTLANSPYIVTDTVVVFPGVTLTIQPGVTVKFDNNKRLEIRQAKIIAEGTSTDSITFTSNSSTPSPGIWSVVYLNNCSGSMNFYYCNFRYANYGLVCSVDSITVKNSNFNNNNYGLHPSCYLSKLDSCNFRNNIITGLLINGYAITDDCNFEMNFNGVDCMGELFSNNCYFKNNTNGIYNEANVYLNNCNISKNQTGLNCIISNSLSIKNSIIDSNSTDGIYSNAIMNDSIINCEIKDNNIGIHEMSENIIVTQNVIEDNNIGIKLEYNYNVSIYCNKICNNTTYDFYYNVNQGSNLSTPYNYWCTPDSASTEAVIYDGYDNINKGLVFFMPLDTSNCYLTTGISNNELEKFSFNVFPNPASDHLTLKFAQNTSKAEVKIYNLLGELKSTSSKSSTESTIDISDLSNGVYIIEVTTERNIMRQKFIKQ